MMTIRRPEYACTAAVNKSYGGRSTMCTTAAVLFTFSNKENSILQDTREKIVRIKRTTRK